MASNFRIILHRNSENLHLKLMGDFDGNSAWQLFNLLKKSCNACHMVIIHTNCLDNVYPFGLQTFHQILGDLNGEQVRLLFTGEKADQMSPEKNLCV